MPTARPTQPPISTYRLQFNKNFTLDDAAALTPYLSSLGVTDLYASPILKAASGSMHGYDICDHSKVNPEIGGIDALHRLSTALRSHGMGFILDFVPNHMGISERENAWWRDVLENGPSSQYARYFDIDWAPLKSELENKVLLPILGEQYGVALDSGKLQIVLSDEGQISLQYFDRDLPLNPRQLCMVIGHNLEKLKAEFLAESPELTEFLSVLFHWEHLPASKQTDVTSASERSREKEVAKRRLAALMTNSPAILAHLKANIETFNGRPGDAGSFDLLHQLLEEQPYRLSSWRTATHEINYRRFFDINELAAIRMEDSEVFDAAHGLIFELTKAGAITGLRLDHVDGLFDPKAYFARLNEAVGPDRRLYLAVEKILSDEEQLPEDWAVHGTTGYDFMNVLNSLFLDRSAAHEFHKLYGRLTGSRRTFKEVAYNSKKLIIETAMASEMHVLAHELNRISEGDRHYRDFTLLSLQEALTEVVSCFPVYRTYVTTDGWSDFDKRNIEAAIRDALRRNPAQETSIYRFIRKVLLPMPRTGLSAEEHARRLRFALKVQQFTGPVQAKGVEDTAFYRLCPLLSLNEVGGDPTHFGCRVEDFHEFNSGRLERYPLAMSATGTHDSKRGEDARARINILSEIPKLWNEQARLWMRINSSARTLVNDEQAPDRSDEYIYYQALIGAWPAGQLQADSEFLARMTQYLGKATKEKKVHTSWLAPSADYDAAISAFVERTLVGTRSKPFLAQFLPFQARVAELGMVNSLAQLALKLLAPGIADFYQGSELWDLSLVDPDSRRPVDFEMRRRIFDAVSKAIGEKASCCEKQASISRLFEDWHDGGVKLFVTAQGLRLRKRFPRLFWEGNYVALSASGSLSSNILAFGRKLGSAAAFVVAPRLVTSVTGFERGLPLGQVWNDTEVDLGVLAGCSFENILTGQRVDATATGQVRVAELLRDFPVAIFSNGEQA